LSREFLADDPSESPLATDKLTPYKSNRDFRRTPDRAVRLGQSSNPGVHLQTHDATRLHYDFAAGLMASLNLGRDPRSRASTPVEHGLAVEVEDHPLDLADFE